MKLNKKFPVDFQPVFTGYRTGLISSVYAQVTAQLEYNRYFKCKYEENLHFRLKLIHGQCFKSTINWL